MDLDFSKLILGTVQLGMPYGCGIWCKELMPEATAFSILDAAWELGIKTLDTSPDYGLAEERILKYMKLNPGNQFQVISKIKNLSECCYNSPTEFCQWFETTKTPSLNKPSLLLHNEQHIFSEEIVAGLNQLEKKNLISNWGLSVYEKDAAKHAAHIPDCSIVQLPYSLLNQEFRNNGVIDLLSAKNKHVHARSVFTQGLLFQQNLAAKKCCENLTKYIEKIRSIARKREQNLMEFALSFVFSTEQINCAVIGVDSDSQLKNITRAGFDLLSEQEYEFCKQGCFDILPESVRPEEWK